MNRRAFITACATASLGASSQSEPMDRNPHITQNERDLLDAGEMLWIVLANVSGGDWDKQTKEWQQAAARWRDNFHAVASKLNAKVA